jgi:Kef-type K+ transport system membrane component KefB
MKTLIVVGLIFAVSYLSTRRIFSTRLSLLGFRYLFFSGTEFLLLGYVIGPRGLGLIPAAIAESLDPVLHLGLGWAGLMFGLQFNFRTVLLYRRRRWVLGFAQALVTSMVVAAGAWLLLPLILPAIDEEMRLRASAILGVCAGPTAPSSIHYFSRIFQIRGRVNRLLKFIVGVDGIPPILLLGLAAGLLHVSNLGLGEGLPGWKWLLVGVLIGIILGLLLAALVGLNFKREELLLFVLGVVALASGLAQYLHLPAVFLSFFAGITTANTAWHREEIHKLAAHAEKPIYLTFLVLTGTFIVLDDARVVVLAATLVTLRLVGKFAGNVVWRWTSFEPSVHSPLLGLTLLSQGGLTLVLAVDFYFLYSSDLGRADATLLVVSAVVVAVLANEVLSPLFIRRLFSTLEPVEESVS